MSMFVSRKHPTFEMPVAKSQKGFQEGVHFLKWAVKRKVADVEKVENYIEANSSFIKAASLDCQKDLFKIRDYITNRLAAIRDKEKDPEEKKSAEYNYNCVNQFFTNKLKALEPKEFPQISEKREAKRTAIQFEAEIHRLRHRFVNQKEGKQQLAQELIKILEENKGLTQRLSLKLFKDISKIHGVAVREWQEIGQFEAESLHLMIGKIRFPKDLSQSLYTDGNFTPRRANSLLQFEHDIAYLVSGYRESLDNQSMADYLKYNKEYFEKPSPDAILFLNKTRGLLSKQTPSASGDILEKVFEELFTRGG